MALKTRVWGAGKILLVTGALAATYLLFAFASLRFALKTREVEVPNLTNRSANEATAVANDMGLAVRVDDMRRPDAKIPAGRVLAQEPPAGSISRRQRSIRVWLSSGIRAATVPALVGETERAAQLRVAQDGITLSGVAEIRSPDYPPDVIVAQTPPAKTVSERVSLLVNRGEHAASYVMSDLIGVNGDRAGEILRGRGFRVAVVASNPYPGVAAGIVLRQSPQGGFRIAPGEPISLEVSR
jgi:eukaryotic-like serine/threonine-protein kinase